MKHECVSIAKDNVEALMVFYIGRMGYIVFNTE